MTLSVGQVTDTVEVVGGTPLLEPNTSSLGTVMDQQKIIDLPLNGRNPMGLANLIPTVRGVGYFGGQVLSTWRTAAVNDSSPTAVNIDSSAAGSAKACPMAARTIPHSPA